MVKHTMAHQTQEMSIDDSNKIQTHIREIIGSDAKINIKKMNILTNIVNKTKNTKYVTNPTIFSNSINTVKQKIQIEVGDVENDDDKEMISFLRCLSIVLYDFKNDFMCINTSSPYYKPDEISLTFFDQNIFVELLELFELERVESCFAMISTDVRDLFEKDRKHRGLNEYDNDRKLNPITAVLFARNGRHDKLKGTEFEFVSDYLKQVHNMGSSNISVKLVYDYFQKYVKDWLGNVMKEKYISEFEQHHEIDIRDKQEKAKKKFSKSDLKSEIRYKERIKTLKSTISDPVKLDKKLKQCEVSYKKRQNSRIDKLTKARIEISKLARDKSGIEKSIKSYIIDKFPPSEFRMTLNTISDRTRIIKNNDIIINETIEELKEQGKQLVNNINKKVLESCKDKESYIFPIYEIEQTHEKHRNTIFEVNFDIVNILKDIFKQITTQYNNTNNTNGVNNEITQTMDIIIGIDCSLIPADDLHMCRNICATLLKATETLPNINIKFVPFRGKNSTTLYADVYETYDDIAYISIHRGSSYIYHAHQYIDELMSKSTVDRKVVIMMTNGYDYEEDYTIQAVEKSKRLGNEIYCIHTDSYTKDKDELIYGTDNIVECEMIEEINKALITLVRDLIGKQ